MVDLAAVAIGLALVAISSVAVCKTRAVLRFRSPGRIEPGSIADWEVWVWRGSGVLMTVVGLLVVAVGVGIIR